MDNFLCENIIGVICEAEAAGQSLPPADVRHNLRINIEYRRVICEGRCYSPLLPTTHTHTNTPPSFSHITYSG